MTTRPILFSTPMVIAVREGRKTETRRLTTKCEAGDELWVREAFRWDVKSLSQAKELYDARSPELGLLYRADCPNLSGSEIGWKPSIHMPRWLTRTWLKVVSVHREPLQSIDDAGAQAEGFASVGDFEAGWNDLNAGRGAAWWQQPDVFVVRFEVMGQ